MGHKSNPTPPVQAPAPPPPADCAHDPETPEASNDLLGLKLSSLFGTASKLDVGTGGLPDSVGISVAAGANDDSTGVSINIDTSGDGGGKPLLSLHSGSDAEITVPVFGEEGVLDGGLGIGGVVGGGEKSAALVSLDGESNAAIEIPVFAGGDGSGQSDIGSLLKAAMLTIGNTGAHGATSGGDIYDGNVPLAGDLSSALDSTLDLLTTTTSLFDVPVVDIGCSDTLDG